MRPKRPPRRNDLLFALAASLAIHGLIAVLVVQWAPRLPEPPPGPPRDVEIVLTFPELAPIPGAVEPVRDRRETPEVPAPESAPPPRLVALPPSAEPDPVPEVRWATGATSMVLLLETYRTGSWVFDSTRADSAEARESTLALAVASLNTHFDEMRWEVQLEMYREAYAKNFLEDTPLMR